MTDAASIAPGQKSWLHDHWMPRANSLAHSATSERSPDCKSGDNRFLRAFRDIRNASRSLLSSLVDRCLVRTTYPDTAKDSVIGISWTAKDPEPIDVRRTVSQPLERPAHSDRDGTSKSRESNTPAEPLSPREETDIGTNAGDVADAVCELIDLAVRAPNGALLKQYLWQGYNAYQAVDAKIPVRPGTQAPAGASNERIGRFNFPGNANNQAWDNKTPEMFI